MDLNCSDLFISCSSAESDDSFTSTTPSLRDCLESEFSGLANNLNVVHINAQSIPAHYPSLVMSLNCQHIHVILVSESFLQPCLPSAAYSLPGFHLIRNDRTCSSYGGVAIYLRDTIPYTFVSKSPQPPPANTAEHIFIEVTLQHSKVLLGVYYSPSLRNNYFSSFEQLLEDLCPSYDHTIIMGDFNTCLLKQDSRAQQFNRLVDSCNLHILPLSSTHHSPNCSPSLLDLILVSSTEHVAKHGQHSADAFSYHDLIFLSYKIRPPKSKLKSRFQRNFSALDVDLLRKDAADIDWAVVLQADTVCDKALYFSNLLINLFDRHAPVRPVKYKHLPAPWLTDEIKRLINKKNHAKAKFKTDASEKYRLRYVRARNRCNTACRDAQRINIHQAVENGDPARLWRFLRSLGIGKVRQDNTLNIDLESLLEHFSNSSALDGTVKANTLRYLASQPRPGYSCFAFSTVSAQDVHKIILSISSNAVGSDGVSRKMIIPILDILCPIITHILNFSLTTGVFPTCWKDGLVTPLPKKSNPVTFNDYRPITILPLLSKVLERIVQGQLSKFVNVNAILNPYQSGFRPGHSTTTALVHISDDIRQGMEKQRLTVLTLLDFSNAFNTVDHDILLATLRSYNISSPVIDWFHTYLSGRRQRIRIDDKTSSWCPISAGVPQGGVLSPLLFSIFINSIVDGLTSSYHLYADDLQIYAQAELDSLPQAISLINQDLEFICSWSNTHGLAVNPSKTQVIILGSPWLTSRVNHNLLPPVIFNGICIPYQQSVRNLGIIFDESLTWKDQIAEVSRRIFASGRSLGRLRNFLPQRTKVSLAQSLLLPILDYADACFLDITVDLLNKLERLQNYCIRFIFGLRKFDHITEYRSRLGWLPVRHRRNLHVLSLLYSILFNPLAPTYLKNRFSFVSPSQTRELRSSHTLRLNIPLQTSKFGSDSFTAQSVRLWNSLPEPIRRAGSLRVFQGKVKSHFLQQELP